MTILDATTIAKYILCLSVLASYLVASYMYTCPVSVVSPNSGAEGAVHHTVLHCTSTTCPYRIVGKFGWHKIWRFLPKCCFFSLNLVDCSNLVPQPMSWGHGV